MLKVAVVGVGGISGSHISVWESLEDVELVALCDIRKECLERYPDKKHYLDFEGLLEKEALDIIDICLPTYFHVDYAIRAMEKGCHVLCEKPISFNKDDVKRVYETAANKNVYFMVGQVVRFWPEYVLLKEIYDTQKYGKLLSGYMSRIGHMPQWSWDGWMQDEKRSGWVPFDLHIHDADFIVYAFGKPNKVISHRAKRPDQDALNAIYEYSDFYIETESAWYAGVYPFAGKYRFQFEEAVVINEGGKNIIYEKSGKVIECSGSLDGDTGKINLPRTNAFRDEISYFVKCILEKNFPDKVKVEELETVIDILNEM